MFASFKYCFSGIVTNHTLLLLTNQRRSVMQVLFKSRRPKPPTFVI